MTLISISAASVVGIGGHSVLTLPQTRPMTHSLPSERSQHLFSFAQLNPSPACVDPELAQLESRDANSLQVAFLSLETDPARAC